MQTVVRRSWLIRRLVTVAAAILAGGAGLLALPGSSQAATSLPCDIYGTAGKRQHRQRHPAPDLDLQRHPRPAVRAELASPAPALVHCGRGQEFSRKLAQRSPIMMVGALVLPEVTAGMTDASATRRPSTPCTRRSGATTARRSMPILQVPTWWW